MVKKRQSSKKKTVVTEQVNIKADAPKEEIKTKPEEPAKEPDFKGIVSLGGSSVASSTIGRNKSGMPWKKASKRSQFNKGPPISYLKSMEEKARLKRI